MNLFPNDMGEPFVTTFEQAPIGLAHVAPDGSWLRANPRLCEILGYPDEELMRLTFQETTHPDDLEGELDNVRRMLAGEAENSSIEKRYIRKDGSTVWASLTVALVRDRAGDPLYFISAVADIDAGKRAETGLRASEQRLARQAALIDLAHDAILVQELASDRITFWSRGAERTYGWTRAEAVGRIAADLLQTEFSVPHEDILAELEADGHWEGDLGHSRSDGSRVVVASRWVLQQAEAGSEVLEVNRDVTAQRRVEAARAAYSAHQERIAEALQRSLLMAPPPDIFPGLTVKAFYQGAEDDVLVGGDFFDIYAADTNKVALVVGDATGKGLEAATYTAEVKFALRALLRESPSPAAALTRLNKFVCDKERLDAVRLGQSYVALSVAVVDTATGDVDAALAGMEMPFLLRINGEAVPFGAGGPLLGVTDDTQYEGQRDTLVEGDLLVMTTDGITEARNMERRLDFFGVEGLMGAVRQETARTASLAEAAQAVVGQVRAFAGGTINDDICLLLARRRARTPEAAR